MKRVLACALLLSVALFAFAGGGKEKAAAGGKPAELEFVTTPEWAVSIEPTLSGFTEKFGIPIRVTVVPYDQLFTHLTTAIVGGQSLDVIELDPGWLAELNKQGMLVVLNDLVDSDDLAEYLPAAIDLNTVGDDLCAFPMVTGLPYFFYNEDMLKENGFNQPPKTWKEVEEISMAAMKAGVADHGIFLGLAPLEGFMVYFDVFLKLHGGDWLNADNDEWIFNNEQGVAALTYMKHLIDTGVVPRASLETPDRESMTTFLAGNAPFHFNWSFTYGMMRDPAQSQITKAVRSALVPGIVIRTYSSMGGGGYAIAKTSKNLEWAVELGKWVTTGDAPRAMLNQRGADMSWVHLYDDPAVYDKYPLLKTYVEQMKIAGIRPNNVLTWYSDFRDNMFLPPVHRALLGQIGIQEALDQAQEAAQSHLEQEGL